jgi:hypothetical protein
MREKSFKMKQFQDQQLLTKVTFYKKKKFKYVYFIKMKNKPDPALLRTLYLSNDMEKKGQQNLLILSNIKLIKISFYHLTYFLYLWCSNKKDIDRKATLTLATHDSVQYDLVKSAAYKLKHVLLVCLCSPHVKMWTFLNFFRIRVLGYQV